MTTITIPTITTTITTTFTDIITRQQKITISGAVTTVTTTVTTGGEGINIFTFVLTILGAIIIWVVSGLFISSCYKKTIREKQRIIDGSKNYI